MKGVHFAWGAVCLVVAIGCAKAPESPSEAEARRRVDSLRALNPSSELEQAVARGDLRAIGVCGYACIAVGIEGADYDLVRGQPLNNVPGTTDVISGPQVGLLNEVADDYATRYNRLLIGYLKTHPTPQPDGQGQ